MDLKIDFKNISVWMRTQDGLNDTSVDRHYFLPYNTFKNFSTETRLSNSPPYLSASTF
jgi:hypothetical protein